MKSFYLDFLMTKESGKVYQFIEDIEEYEEGFTVPTDEGNLKILIKEPVGNIYVNCIGGENIMAATLYHFLNNRPYNYNYIVTGSFSSNAILLLLALNPKNVTIMRQCMSTIHLSNYNHPVSSLAFNEENSPYLGDLTDFKLYLGQLLDLYKFFLTKEELLIVKKGMDITLGAKRVQETFNNLKKSKSFQTKARNIFEITL